MSHEVSAQVLIDMPVGEAWAKLRDISLAHNYVPGIVKTVIVSDKKEGVGASRYVYRNARSYIQETVEEWQEGTGFLIRLHKGDKPPAPFRQAEFSYRIDKLDDKRCKLTTTMIYEMPWGPVGKLLNALLFAKVVKGNVRDVVLCLKQYYESGKPVTEADLKTLRQIPEEKLPQPYQ